MTLRCDACGQFAKPNQVEAQEAHLGGVRHKPGNGCWPDNDPVPPGVPEPSGWREKMKGKAVSFICDECGIHGGVPYLQKDKFDGDPCMDPKCDGTWHVQHGTHPDTDYDATIKNLEVDPIV